MNGNDPKPQERKIGIRAVAAAARFARPAPHRHIAQWPPKEPTPAAAIDAFPAAPGFKHRH